MRLCRDIFIAICVGVAVALLFRSAAFATYYIPSESMVPTLQVGDHLAVSKYAYGWGRYSFGTEAPIPLEGRVLGALPERGDVVVFGHPVDGRAMIKRVIGLPGDTVQIRKGQVILNGKRLRRQAEASYSYREYEGGVANVTRYIETLPNGRQYEVVLRAAASAAEDTSVFRVPPGHLFMLGDNRDNSADSRFSSMGYVPLANLIGRAETILFSNYVCHAEPGLACATPRALAAIN